jgi:hypothetical protein
MTTDVREDILAAIEAALGTIDDVTVLRNATTVAPEQRPALVLLDGDEEVDLDKSKASPKVAMHVEMLPLVLIYLSKASAAGSELNRLRLEVLRVMAFTDDIREAQNGTSPAISARHPLTYLGASSGFTFSQATDADMALRYSLTYLLNPAHFV